MDADAEARFEIALDALLAHDAERLRVAVEGDPGVAHLVACGNTLLEAATQPLAGKVPREVIAVLIEAGARLDRALNLAGCWNLPELAAQLLEAGANPSACADAGITALESAAMHGSSDAADVLVQHGLHRRSLWLAAAAGRLDLVRDWVSEDGSLLAPPGDYRPDLAAVGRPPGGPATEDPDEIAGEAMVFAAANGRIGIVDYLVGVGVDVNARPYRNTTGLHLAIQFRKLAMVRHLLELGASATIQDDQYASDALGWARACDDGSDASSAIRQLLESVS